MNGGDMAGDGAATWVYLRELVPVPAGTLASAVAHPHSFAKAVVVCSDINFSMTVKADHFWLFVLRIKREKVRYLILNLLLFSMKMADLLSHRHNLTAELLFKLLNVYWGV